MHITGHVASSSDRIRSRDSASGFSRLLLLTGCVVMAFDDLAVAPPVLGGLGSSPAAVFFCLFVLSTGLQRISRTARALWRAIGALNAYGFAVSCVGALIVVSETALAYEKVFSTTLTFLIFAAVAVAGVVAIQSCPDALAIGCAIALAGLAGSAVAETSGAMALDGVGWLHGTPNYQLRVRGTRFEASSLGSGLLTLSLLVCLALRGRRFSLPLALILSLATVAISASRGAFVVGLVLGASALVLSLRRFKLTSRWLGLVFAVAVVVLAVRIDLVLGSAYWSTLGLEAATSDAVRGVWSETALRASAIRPWGLGYFEYYERLPELLTTTLSFAPPQVAIEAQGELGAMRVSEDTLSPKTLPTVLMVYFGLPGLLAAIGLYVWLFSAIRNSSSQLRAIPALAVLGFAAVSASFFWSIFSWDQALLMGAILGYGNAGSATVGQLHPSPAPPKASKVVHCDD